MHLAPASGGPVRGRVLLSYIIDGVLAKSERLLSHAHPHFWETWAMAECFRQEGYAVDVIHWTRRGPLLGTDYDIYVDVRRNFERNAAKLPPRCVKVAHMDTAYHGVHNGNQLRRLRDLRERRGMDLAPFKLVEETRAAQSADHIVVLGNDFTAESFAFAGKPVHRVRLSSAFLYPFPEQKDFHACRRRFLWFGSDGFVHKGLNLVLEAFAGMPDFELVVCGPLDHEPRFVEAFSDLLYGTPNIRAEGWVDVASPRFRELTDTCLGMVYPSCSEGGGGCVLTMMHAGVIPVVTREASVDVEPSCGVVLADASVEALRTAIRSLSEQTPEALQAMARAAWTWARTHHTRDRFLSEYRAFVRSLADDVAKRRASAR